ncbi:MAG: hypothetical protein WC880_00035 [Candidatus Paceibacterota bacterium]
MNGYKGEERNFCPDIGNRSRRHANFMGIPSLASIPLIEAFDRNPDKGDLLDVLGGYRESRTAIVD